MANNAPHMLPNNKKKEIKSFFFKIGTRLNLAEGEVSHVELDNFASSIGKKIELAAAQQRHIDKFKATRFNLFNLIEPDENKLSDIIAILLDPEGEHGQGDVFLREFFKMLGVIPNEKIIKKAKVQREARTHGILKHRRRIDIFIDAGVLLAIENKIDALEQKEQVKEYFEHLHHSAMGRGLQALLIYLTPDGRIPESIESAIAQKYKDCGKLHCWSYQLELRNWIGTCRRLCKSMKIQDFLSDFIGYIDSTLKREPIESREDVEYDN